MEQLSNMSLSQNLSYTTQELLSYRREYPIPEGLLRIVLTGNNVHITTTATQPRRKAAAVAAAKNRQQQRGAPGEWNRVVPVLQQSENSFSVARRQKKNQTECDVIVGDIRGILNKVTADNFDAIVEEIKTSKLYVYAGELEEADEEEFLMDIAKIFVRKSQIDHDFNHLYAKMAKEITQHIDIFGDILYEVCRESIPTSKYENDDKKDYVGALLLLVELRKLLLISSGGIFACIDRLIAAIERCDPNVIYSVQNEGESQSTALPANPMEQTELCVELICKVVPLYLMFEHPEWINRHLTKLRDLQQQKDRIKPRVRFMLADFFKQVELTKKKVSDETKK